jgi:hypothetical protein
MIDSRIFIVDRCACCGSPDNLESHHIIPKCLDKDSKDTMLLCRKHHDILHHFLLRVVFNNRFDTIPTLFQKIKDATTMFCKMEWMKWSPQTREFWANHCILCRNNARLFWWDYDNQIGLFGLCEYCGGIEQKEYQRSLKFNSELKPKTFQDWFIDERIIKSNGDNDKDIG